MNYAGAKFVYEKIGVSLQNMNRNSKKYQTGKCQDMMAYMGTSLKNSHPSMID